MRIRTLAASSAILISTSVLVPTVAHADGSNTLYVTQTSTCSDTGSGTQAVPFCTIQAAANAANPGDVVLIGAGIFDSEVDITRSGTAGAPITFLGTGAQSAASNRLSIIEGTAASPINHAFTVTGASYINIEDLTVGYTAADAILVTNSSDVTINGIIGNGAGEEGAAGNASSILHVTGTSTAVTVQRSRLWSSTGPEVTVDSSVSGTTVSTNLLELASASAIAVSGATDTSITSNTAIGLCGPVFDVTDSAAGTSIENNVLDGGYADQNGCPSSAVAAEISVDSSSTATTTLDYNDVYENQVTGADYVWGGKAYQTAAALDTATGQGAHDNNLVNGDDLVEGSPLINSANSAAPGELATDYNYAPRVDDPTVPNTGAGPYGYYDRGYLQFQDPFTQLVTDTFTYSDAQIPVGGQLTLTATGTDTWNDPTGYYFSFGDGTTATNSTGVATHTYSTPGTYFVDAYLTLDGVQVGGYIGGRDYEITVMPAHSLVPALTASPQGALSVQADGSGTVDAWNITGYSFNFGDGSAVTTSTASIVSHTYAKPGTYTVTETVTDAGDNSASTTQSVTTAGSDFTAYGPTRILDTRNGTGTGGVIAKIRPGSALTLKVEGTGSIPATGVTAVVVNLTATDTVGSGYVTAYADGTSTPDVSNLNYSAGRTVPNLAVVPVGADGSIDLYNGGAEAGSIDLLADVTGYFTQSAGAGYTALSPDRLLDTRNGTGTGGVVAKAAPGKPVVLTIAGADGGSLPTGVTAVALNVTVTDASGSGFVEAYPDGSAVPATSNVNYVPGQTVANSVIVPVGKDGKIDLADSGSSAGPVDLIADVTGYYSASSAGAYVAVTPARLMDTRTNTAVGKGGTISFDVSSIDVSIPSGAVGFVFNLTVTEPTGTGFITAYPYGAAVPNASNVNYTPGLTIANLAQVTPGPDGPGGAVSFTNGGSSAGSVELIADIFGYYATS